MGPVTNGTFDLTVRWFPDPTRQEDYNVIVREIHNPLEVQVLTLQDPVR